MSTDTGFTFTGPQGAVFTAEDRDLTNVTVTMPQGWKSLIPAIYSERLLSETMAMFQHHRETVLIDEQLDDYNDTTFKIVFQG